MSRRLIPDYRQIGGASIASVMCRDQPSQRRTSAHWPPGAAGPTLQGRARLHRPVISHHRLRGSLAQLRRLAAAPSGSLLAVPSDRWRGDGRDDGRFRRPLVAGRGRLHCASHNLLKLFRFGGRDVRQGEELRRRWEQQGDVPDHGQWNFQGIIRMCLTAFRKNCCRRSIHADRHRQMANPQTGC